MNLKKKKIAEILDKIGVGRLLFSFSKAFYGRHIRVVNYHTTPHNEAAEFEAQLQFFSKHYSSVTYADLVQFFKTGKWHKDKPGLIISFDDGVRDNFDIGAPLLEKYGFIGWFFVPPGFVDATSAAQMEFVGKTEGRYKPTYNDGRYIMSWDEIRKLYATHVIGNHTMTHHRMNVDDSNAVLEHEIVASQQLMEQHIGKPMQIFCWVGGEEHTYTAAAAEKIRAAGYRFSFMTNTYPVKAGQQPLQLQRTNVECEFPLSLVRFQLSVVMDMSYRGKRNRVNKVTA